MNERLTLQDLIDSLSQKQGMTKKDAETFLRELIAVISENIETLEPVKIKDFGTFKLVKVSARKSVDVNTGEAIEIPAHYKLSFSPDKSLKEAVNHPFAHFESVVLEEGVSFDSLESSEIPEDADEDIEEEETIEPTEVIHAVSPADVEVKEEIIENVSLVEPEAVVEENSIEEDKIEEDSTAVLEEVKEIEEVAPTVSEEVESLSNNTPDENVVEEGSIEKPEATLDQEEESTVAIEEVSEDEMTESQEMFERHKRKTLRRRFISMSFIVLLMLAAFALGGLYFQEIMKCFSGQLKENEVVLNTEKRERDITTRIEKEETDSLATITNQTDSVATERQDSIKEEIIKPSAVVRDTIKSGKTLRLISLKHYGHRSFWPYIYEENRDVIKNPNNVPIDTELIIPAPEKYGIDAKDSKSIEKAKALESKLIKELGL